MSLFRRPGDSSSSSGSSDEESEYEEENELQQDSLLSRVNTLDSASSGQQVQPQPQRPPRPPLDARQSSTQNVRDLLLHSLLEERTIREVAAQLGKDPSDPEAQRLGRASYKEIARQISNNVDDAYASDEMQGHRTTANEGINRLMQSNLTKLPAVPEISSHVLVTLQGNTLPQRLPQQPSQGLDIFSGIPAPVQLQLRGYPHLQTDRYIREFCELEIVGKGGYGKVFKAKHKLDGSFYAVKRIPVSPAKVARIQEHGPEELESMLEEVRSLARFDHNNIIRYHNAWLEFTTLPTEATGVPGVPVLRHDRLLEDRASPSFSAGANDLDSQLDHLSFDDPHVGYENSNSAGIVFEFSEPGEGANEPQSEGDNMAMKETLTQTRRGNRRGSQASQMTIATISSTKSKMSAVEDVDEEDDDDVENIPRSHVPGSREAVTEMSDSMITNSDVPHHLMQKRTLGPVLMLNVQMSLCESNLAAFLSSDQSGCAGQGSSQHCFHPCVSLELLDNIVSGVEYLHSQGVVHRDLKPANVFLSLSTARHPPYGSIDMSSCTSCPKRDHLHMTPRIGDFGLVAALSDSCVIPEPFSKPVGTEFYRPVTVSRINEKLDIYALGVIAFEMLQKFGTRMERVDTLTGLRQGLFPDGFAESHGGAGVDIQQLISGMMGEDEQKRFSCDEVKEEIRKIVQRLKA